MKAILTYDDYFNLGKQYQMKFIYENETEIKKTSILIKKIKEKYKEITPLYKKQYGYNIVTKTNISKESLLPLISMIMTLNNIELVIGNQKYTNFELKNIKKAIDELHLIITLNKNNYLGINNTYYITFKYAETSQRDEISYYIYNKLSYEIKEKYPKEIYYIIPCKIDQNGNLTTENTGIIGAINIQEQMIPFVLKRFVEKYNAILIIGNQKFKDNIDKQQLLNAINNLNTEEESQNTTYNREKTRKKTKLRQINH